MSILQKIVLVLGAIAIIIVLSFSSATKIVTTRNSDYDPNRPQGYFYNNPYKQETRIDYVKTGFYAISIAVGTGVLYLLAHPKKKK